MAFGHSILAMSGEETLAQVNREIQHPKLKNLKRAAIVIAIYSLIFTGGATLLASMLIPDWPADPHLPGQPDRRLGHVHGGAAGLAHCISDLRGAGRLPDSLGRHQHFDDRLDRRADARGRRWRADRLVPQAASQFGTSYRIVNLVFILQMFTIIASRGNVIMLGEAYAFGVIWSFTFNSLAMLVLRWKYKGERGWKVPPNIRIGKTEIPVGLLSVFLVLLATAIVNLFTKSVATVSGIAFCRGVLHHLYRLGAGEPAQACPDRDGR